MIRLYRVMAGASCKEVFPEDSGRHQLSAGVLRELVS